MWIGDSRLCLAFPRLYALENNKDCTVAVKMNGTFVSSFRRDVVLNPRSSPSSLISLIQWFCPIRTIVGSGTLMVKVFFRLKMPVSCLMTFFPPKADTPTRWVKSIPIKLTSSLGMSRLEDLDHLSFCCSMAIDVTRSICKWWNLGWVPVDSYLSWLSWFNSIRMQSSSKMVLKGVFYTAWWSILTYRNHLLFADSKPRKEVIFDDIVSRSFLWCIARGKHSFR
nr:RNA-directed DNA polymerase, eukaryota [Tanacetum cinerariifolium]